MRLSPAGALVTKWLPLQECLVLKACLLGSGADAALIDDPVALNIAMVLRSLAPIDDLHEALLRVIRFSFKQVLVPCLASMPDMGLS